MSKARNLSQMIVNEGGDINASSLGNVTPALISDKANTSTGALDLPSGTTAQRPLNPTTGYVRYNTDTDCLENYTSTGWLKVSIQTPIVSSVSGTIYSGVTSTISFSGLNFGAGVASSLFA